MVKLNRSAKFIRRRVPENRMRIFMAFVLTFMLGYCANEFTEKAPEAVGAAREQIKAQQLLRE